MASNNQDSEGSKKGSSNRGFASMDPQRQREIASEGGRAAHEKGTAHEFTSEEAREAGRKGGQARSQSNRSSSNAVCSGVGADFVCSVTAVLVVRRSGLTDSMLASMPQATEWGTRGIHGASSAGPLETNYGRRAILPALPR